MARLDRSERLSSAPRLERRAAERALPPCAATCGRGNSLSGSGRYGGPVAVRDQGDIQSWWMVGATGVLLAAGLVAFLVGFVFDGDEAAETVSPSPMSSSTDSVTPSSRADSSDTSRSSASAMGPSQSSTFQTQPVEELRPVPVAQQTPDGAVEFLQWYVEMIGYAETTGQIGPIADNSEAGSPSATNAIERIEEVYQGGNRIERSGPYQVVDASATDVDLNGYVVVTFNLNNPSQRTLSATGEVVTQSEGQSSLPAAAGLQWTDNRWLLRDVGQGTA